MNSVIFADNVELQSGNPALDFLNEACALFYRPRSGDENVKCPFCRENTPENWQPFMVISDWKGNALQKTASAIEMAPGDERFYNNQVRVQWMVCPNDKCKQIIVHIRRTLSPTRGIIFDGSFRHDEHWFALPRKPYPRPIDSLVRDPYRRDYLEAALILDDSPRMSSVLSRRILQDLLEQFAGRTEYKLEDRIDNFIADAKYPSTIKDNLHYLRDIANFGAHTKKDKSTGEIIDVSQDEAEWTLEVVDDLFDYFIVAPEKAKARRVDWDAKRGQTGSPRQARKPKKI